MPSNIKLEHHFKFSAEYTTPSRIHQVTPIPTPNCKSLIKIWHQQCHCNFNFTVIVITIPSHAISMPFPPHFHHISIHQSLHHPRTSHSPLPNTPSHSHSNSQFTHHQSLSRHPSFPPSNPAPIQLPLNPPNAPYNPCKVSTWIPRSAHSTPQQQSNKKKSKSSKKWKHDPYLVPHTTHHQCVPLVHADLFLLPSLLQILIYKYVLLDSELRLEFNMHIPTNHTGLWCGPSTCPAWRRKFTSG